MERKTDKINAKYRMTNDEKKRVAEPSGLGGVRRGEPMCSPNLSLFEGMI
jgi:hypothetical protein